MGINTSFSKFLFYQKSKGINFESTVTLGRMKLYTSVDEIKNNIVKYGSSKKIEEVNFTDEYAEPFFKILGATKQDSMDYSDYENANILQDLNKAVPENLHNKYSVVLDSGTLEHVFNFPVAIKSCMDMVKVGGHFIGVTPSNNMFGHGFYQFSPELYYRVFAKENGFEITQMCIGVFGDDGDVEKWYDVKDPVDVNSRVTMINSRETFLFVVAEKIAAVEPFTTTPYQSDYAATWESKIEADGNAESTTLKSVYRKYVPKTLKNKIQQFRGKINKPRYADNYVGIINPKHFTEINF